MAFRLAQLAELVHGTLVGDGDLEITGATVLGDAGPHEITLVDHIDRLPKLALSSAAAAVLPRGMQVANLPAIEVDDVHEAFTAIVLKFRPPRRRPRLGISTHALISPTARLDADVEVHPGVTIGDDATIGAGSTIYPGAHIGPGCRIAEGVTIHANAVLYDDTVVGPRVVIHSGAIIGSAGFGYKLVDGRHQLAAQLGYVRIDPDVEIGANTTIDRGTYGPTVIGEGTKIDNQVQIGHNCRIGRHNLIVSQVGIAGSTSTGDYVVMAGQCGIRDHVHIGSRAVLAAMSGVVGNIPEGTRFMGIPATPEREQKLKQASLSKLPEMRRQLRALEATVARMQNKEGPSGTTAAA